MNAMLFDEEYGSIHGYIQIQLNHGQIGMYFDEPIDDTWGGTEWLDWWFQFP